MRQVQPKKQLEAGPWCHIHVPGKHNLTTIHSRQDWANTYPKECKLYIKMMGYLQDHGEKVRCYSCWFMDIMDPMSYTANMDKMFGLTYFDNLASLEGWSKWHKTHLDIFGGFLAYVKHLNDNVLLR